MGMIIIVIIGIVFMLYKLTIISNASRKKQRETTESLLNDLLENARKLEDMINKARKDREKIINKNAPLFNSPVYKNVPKKYQDKLLKLHMMAMKGTKYEKIVASKKIGIIANRFSIKKEDYNKWAKHELSK